MFLASIKQIKITCINNRVLASLFTRINPQSNLVHAQDRNGCRWTPTGAPSLKLAAESWADGIKWYTSECLCQSKRRSAGGDGKDPETARTGGTDRWDRPVGHTGRTDYTHTHTTLSFFQLPVQMCWIKHWRLRHHSSKIFTSTNTQNNTSVSVQTSLPAIKHQIWQHFPLATHTRIRIVIVVFPFKLWPIFALFFFLLLYL